jgi:hypothetical protein
MDQKKLFPLYVGKLTLDQLLGLLGETVSVSGSVFAKTEQPLLLARYDILNTDVVLLSTLMNKSRRSLLTPVLKGIDKQINRLYGNIKRVIKTYEIDVDTNRSAAAKRLHQALEPYWNVTKKSMTIQMAEMNELILRINSSTQLSGDLVVLVLTPTWSMLQSEVAAFQSTYEQRLAEISAAESPSASSLRETVIRDYERFCDMLLQVIELDTTEELTLLFNEINLIRIKYAPRRPIALEESYTSVEPIAIQIYNGRVITPIPRVFLQLPTGTVELVFAKDFFVTYRNNVEVGEATLIIHGKGAYCGQYITTFHIARQS